MAAASKTTIAVLFDWGGSFFAIIILLYFEVCNATNRRGGLSPHKGSSIITT
jgi:hypothetical protein